MEMFKPGDKFIQFTKRGGVNKGEIKDIHLTTVWDTANLCRYMSYSIFTTNGVRLNLDGSDGHIYKIDSEMDEERAKKFNKIMKTLSVRKNRPSKEKIHSADENKET
jgi:hypothetical protein